MNKELIQDYKNTDYIIYPNDVFKKGLVIRIDQNTPELDIYLKSISLNSWVFITAYNPFSREESDEINHKNQKDLISEIKNDYRYFEGEGKGNNTDWKAEKSILILGISKEKALELKNKYSQNAVVFGELNNRAKLA